MSCFASGVVVMVTVMLVTGALVATDYHQRLRLATQNYTYADELAAAVGVFPHLAHNPFVRYAEAQHGLATWWPAVDSLRATILGWNVVQILNVHPWVVWSFTAGLLVLGMLGLFGVWRHSMDVRRDVLVADNMQRLVATSISHGVAGAAAFSSPSCSSSSSSSSSRALPPRALATREESVLPRLAVQELPAVAL